MQILLTDSAEIYEQSNSDKILTDGFVIVNSTIFDHEQTAHFNAQLNGVENEASRLMIEELEDVSFDFPEVHTNRFLETRNSNYDKAYSLLYPYFKDFVTRKYLLEILVKQITLSFPELITFNFVLSSKYQSIAFSEYLNSVGTIDLKKATKLRDQRFLKNLFYRWSSFKRKKRRSCEKENKIVLFIFDTINDIDLFKSFFELAAKDKSIHLDIIQIESGISPDKAVSAKQFECDNIQVYKLQDFRSPLVGGFKHFNRILKSSYPQYSHFINSQHQLSAETYSTFINAALNELKPRVVLYDNTGEVGRQMTDVARYLKIKSTNVEYALFSNDFIHMASNICYDVRYCLGDASISVWKDKKDPSLRHVPIGFLKLDHSENLSSEGDNFKWTKGAFDKLIFFASTWAGTNSLYNQEKTIVVKELSELCLENNWGLVIKKHPAENDKLLESLEVIKQKHVFLYQHHEAQLFQLLAHCDIVCTQNSSITAEALVHSKPTIFYNKSEQNGLAQLIPMSDEPFVFFVNTKTQFADIVKNQISKLNESVFNNASFKYLYKPDQNASFRLLEELKSLCL